MMMKRVLKICLMIMLFCIIVGIIIFPSVIEHLFSHSLSDSGALKILSNALHVEIDPNSASVVYTDYSTNFMDEGYLIVCDLYKVNLEELVNKLGLKKTFLPIKTEYSYYTEEFNDVLRKYYNENELYCRYGYDMLIDGTPHQASVFMISLSKNGRLLVYVEE